MDRRVLLIEAGKAFPVVVGGLCLIRCKGLTLPNVVEDVTGISTTVNGHSHTANVAASDQLHPTDKSYTSSTDSAHSHMVTLTANQLQTIASGGSVTVTSAASQVTGNHHHDFTFDGCTFCKTPL